MNASDPPIHWSHVPYTYTLWTNVRLQKSLNIALR